MFTYYIMAKTPSPRKTRRNKIKNPNSTRAKSVSPKTNLWNKLYKAILKNSVQDVNYLVNAGVLNQAVPKIHQTGRFYGTNDLTAKCINASLANIGDMNFNEQENNNAITIIGILENGGLHYDPKKISSAHMVNGWTVMDNVRFLIEKGVSINTQYDRTGATILMDIIASAVYDYETAERWNPDTVYPEVISELFDMGVDINIQNDDGLDAFMIAAGHSGCYNIYQGGAADEKCTVIPSIPVLNMLLDNLIRVNKRYNYKNEGETSEGDYKTLLKTLENIDESYDYDKDELEQFILKFKKYNPTKPTKSAKMKKISPKRPKSRSRSSGASEGGRKN